MPRNDLTLADKIALLDEIANQPPDTSQRRLAAITGVPKSTVARVIQQGDKLRLEWASMDEQQQRKIKHKRRKREGKDPDVDDALNQWFSTAAVPDARVTGPMLKNKAEELAKNLGHNGFKATDGWLSRWKSRHDIKLKTGNDKQHHNAVKSPPVSPIPKRKGNDRRSITGACDALQIAKQLVSMPNEESKEEIFGKYVTMELKQITDVETYNETKWSIQIALMEGIKKQRNLQKPQCLPIENCVAYLPPSPTSQHGKTSASTQYPGSAEFYVYEQAI